MAIAGCRSAATRRPRRAARPDIRRGNRWHAKKRCRAGENIKELTIRGIILGAVLTVILTAANVYAGLKIGLTFATSIPAAVISMAVLRAFSDSTIQENNIVQTIASAAGTLSAIMFVLPGLVMVGWWTGFPYWLSVAVIAIGGILGVMYSVPLRRALVTGTDLPYPGRCRGRRGAQGRFGHRWRRGEPRGLVLIVLELDRLGRLLRCSPQTKLRRRRGEVASGSDRARRRFGEPVDAADRGRASGRRDGRHRNARRPDHQLGLPRPRIDTALAGAIPAGAGLDDFVHGVFVQKVRFIGAGTIGVAAIWTLLKIIGADHRGHSSARSPRRASARPVEARPCRSPNATFRSGSWPRRSSC